MQVNIALLTVTDTRTIDTDKSGSILVKKIKESNHNLNIDIDGNIILSKKLDFGKVHTIKINEIYDFKYYKLFFKEIPGKFVAYSNYYCGRTNFDFILFLFS